MRVWSHIDYYKIFTHLFAVLRWLDLKKAANISALKQNVNIFNVISALTLKKLIYLYVNMYLLQNCGKLMYDKH